MFKEKFYTQSLSDALGKFASIMPFTPMGITYLSLVISGAAFYMAFIQKPLTAATLFIVGSIFDALDGGLARLTGLKSKLGAFVDGTIDRFVDFMLIYSFTFFDLPTVVIPLDNMITLLAYSTLMPVFVVAYANHRQAVDDPDEKKVWRIINRGELLPLLIVSLLLVPYAPNIVSLLLFIILCLNIVTTFQSIYLAISKSPERSVATKIFRTKKNDIANNIIHDSEN